jgi:copper chaperone CopZ
VENVLKSLDGVVNAKADYVKGLATVTYDPAQITPTQMVEAINGKTFFRANLPRTEGVTAEASSRLTLLPFIVGSVLMLLVGVIVWQVVIRRQADRATVKVEE